MEEELIEHIKQMDAKIAGGMLLDDEDYIRFFLLCRVRYLETSEIKYILKEARQ